MKVTIDINDTEFEGIIKKFVSKQMKEMGLLRFIREEIKVVFYSWQKTHTNTETKIGNLNTRIINLEKRDKK